MKRGGFIITITGPSQSGKSLVMKKITELGEELYSRGVSFSPKKIKKYTTRYLRLDEMELSDKGEEVDVEYIKNIPDTCDLVYQTYGVRYGIETSILTEELKSGNSPIIVINDIRVVEEIKKFFSGKVLSVFLFRKIPELDDFKKEAQNRGNVSEPEVVARYEKAIAIYRTYIENIVLFDKVILNSVEYLDGLEHSRDTILDRQLKNILLPIILEEKTLKEKMEYPKLSRIFVFAGNAASGKDEIIRALLTMGKLQAKVLPKYTMRQQEPEDGEEIICRYIPKCSFLKSMKKEYFEQKNKICENLNKMNSSFIRQYKKEYSYFKQQLEKEIKDEYGRFWEAISKEMEKCGKSSDEILNQYFENNPDYKDLQKIKQEGNIICKDQNVAIYESNNHLYLVYGEEQKLYGCDVTEVQRILNENKYHLVIVASEIGVVNVLRKKFGEDRVRLIYAHSEISVKEFEANASDITKDEKKKRFQEILDNYTSEISNYDHVTIYAKAQLTYEQTSKEEELIDQMFRLLRAY